MIAQPRTGTVPWTFPRRSASCATPPLPIALGTSAIVVQ
jgi:hypothetical protein